jgi:hypothetical protein
MSGKPFNALKESTLKFGSTIIKESPETTLIILFYESAIV